jgi:hypothetical protein
MLRKIRVMDSPTREGGKFMSICSLGTVQTALVTNFHAQKGALI